MRKLLDNSGVVRIVFGFVAVALLAASGCSCGNDTPKPVGNGKGSANGKRIERSAAQKAADRGGEFLFEGQYDKAIATYTEAIELNPDFAEAYLNRGISFSATKQYEKAIEDFTAAIRIDPTMHGAYYNRGKAYEASGRPTKAKKDFKTAKIVSALKKRDVK